MKHYLRRFQLLTIIGGVLCIFAFPATSTHALSQPNVGTEVSLRILRLEATTEDSCGPMEFYAQDLRFQNGTRASMGYGKYGGNDIRPNWSVKGTVIDGVTTVDTFMHIREDDDFWCGGNDDTVDINPLGNLREVTLRVDLSTNQVWLLNSDGFPYSKIGVVGSSITLQGYNGNERARITFQIDVVPSPLKLNTYYNVVAMHSNKCLDVSGVSTANGSAIQQWECLGTEQANQLWRLMPVGQYFEIVAQHSGKCMDVSDGSPTDRALIHQWECLGASQPNQLWSIVPVDDWFQIGGHYQLVPAHIDSYKCANVDNKALNNGTVVLQYSCQGNGASNQLWRFMEMGSIIPPPPPVEYTIYLPVIGR